MLEAYSVIVEFEGRLVGGNNIENIKKLIFFVDNEKVAEESYNPI
jgi:hypothetical protein